jgi:hypothetical protein
VWTTNYLDVTDYVKSLATSNQTSVTFVIARIVRYDVNQYSNSSYYANGVYDSDGRLVEIATRENATPGLRPALVVFRDPQTAPVLAPVADQRINPGARLTLTNSASDAESPPQVLTFRLLAGPDGAQLDPVTGLLSWRPVIAQASSTNLVRIAVSDDGPPVLSATQAFQVIVNPVVRPSVRVLGWEGDSPRLAVFGQDGPDYALYASTNLVDWQWLLATSSPPSPWSFTDQQATNLKQRFYRVTVGP